MKNSTKLIGVGVVATIIALLYFKSKKTNSTLTSKSTTTSNNEITTTDEVTAPKSSSVLPYPIDVVPVKPTYIAPRTPIYVAPTTPTYVNPINGGRIIDYVSGGSRGVDVTPIDSIGIDYGVRIGNGGGSSAINLGIGDYDYNRVKSNYYEQVMQ